MAGSKLDIQGWAKALARRDGSAGGGGLSTGAVVGIAVVGSFILFATLSTLFVLYLRARDRRHHEELVAAARIRRLSGYPGGQLNIDDWGGVPEPEAAYRKSNFFSFRPMQGWDGLNSQEDVNEKPSTSFGKRISRHFGGNNDEEQSRMSWPLSSQRPLEGSIRMSKLRNKSPLSVITEVTQASNATLPEGLAELPGVSTPPDRTPRLSNAQEETSNAGSQKPSFESNGRTSKATLEPPSNRATRNSSLRSVSGGRSTSSIVASIRESMSPRLEQRISPNARPISSIRAVSFSSQASGLAPDGPVPSLPVEARRAGRSASAKFSIVPDSPRNSASSGESASSSILAIEDSVTMSSPGTDLTSPTPSSRKPRPETLILDKSPRFKGQYDQGSLSPKPQHGQPQYHRQSRLRASLRGSLIRTQSTSLSRSASTATARQGSVKSKGSLGRSKTVSTPAQARMDARTLFGPRPDPSGISSPDPAAKRHSTVEFGTSYATSPAVNDSRPYSFDFTPKRPAPKPSIAPPTRASSVRSDTSALRSVSGNVIVQPERLSLVEDSPVIEPSPQPSPEPGSPSNKPPSALSTNRSRSFRKSHKRQKSVRISIASTYGEGSRCSPMPEEPEEQTTESKVTEDLIPRPLSTSHHPQTRTSQGADPSDSALEIATGKQVANRTPNRIDPIDVLYSPTLSMFKLYNEMSRDNSRETLDKRFSSATASSALSLPLGSWGPASAEGTPNTQMDAATPEGQLQEFGSSRPPSAMLTPTPAPLVPGRSVSRTPSKRSTMNTDVSSTPGSAPPVLSQRATTGLRPLHGPRLLPSPKRNIPNTLDRNSIAESPANTDIDTPAGSNPTSPDPAESPVRESILLLRRMNSEVAESAINRHSARYLNMQRNPTGWKTPAVGKLDATPSVVDEASWTDSGIVITDRIHEITEEDEAGGMTPWTDVTSVAEETEADHQAYQTPADEESQWLGAQETPFQTPFSSPQRRPFPERKDSTSNQVSTPVSSQPATATPSTMRTMQTATQTPHTDFLAPTSHLQPRNPHASPTPASRYSGRYPPIGAAGPGIGDPKYGDIPPAVQRNGFTGSPLKPVGATAAATTTPFGAAGRRRKPLGPAPASASAISRGAAPRWKASPGTAGNISVPSTPTRQGPGVAGPFRGGGTGIGSWDAGKLV